MSVKNTYFPYFKMADKFDYKKEVNGFQVYLLEGENGKNIYRLQGKIGCSSDKCIKYLSNPDVRQALSKGKVKFTEINRTDNDNWYELVEFKSNDGLLDDVYSIEKLVKTKNYLYSYSEIPNEYQNKRKALDKRDNLFSCVIAIPQNDECLLDSLLVFGEFEMSQDLVVDATLDYYNRLKTIIMN